MLRRLDPPTKAVAKLMVFDYIETFYNTRRRHSALIIARPRSSSSTGSARSARVVLAAAAWAARPALLSRSALAALAVNNSSELFKPPETTRSNHRRAFNAVAKPLTSINNKSPVRVFEERSLPSRRRRPALLSSKLVKGAKLKVYPGVSHGICSTLKDEVNADLA